MAVFGVSALLAVFAFIFGVGTEGGLSLHEVPLMLVGYGFGASFVALFAQLGGGIYTKVNEERAALRFRLTGVGGGGTWGTG
jgi:Na+/H+-translocating membrane pyrophosphatase